MRKLTSYLLISLDGVVEAPRRFFREDVYPDILPLIGDTIAEQDEWSRFDNGVTLGQAETAPYNAQPRWRPRHGTAQADNR